MKNRTLTCACASQIDELVEALERIAGLNDLEGVPDSEIESAVSAALYECELIARAALSRARGEAE